MTSSALTKPIGSLPRNLLYLLIAFPLALLGFCLLVPVLALGAGTAILGIGIAICVLALLIARAAARVEIGLQHNILHRSVAQPIYQRADDNEHWLRRLITPLTDPQSWLDVVWVIASLWVSMVTFLLALGWTLLALGTVAAPISVFVLDKTLPPHDYTPALQFFGITNSRPLEALFEAAVCLVFLVTLPYVLQGLARLQAGFSTMLLTQRAESQQQIGALRTSRAAGRVAEADQLRRLERDLHDGPQQDLIRLNLDLARARKVAASDPERAQQMIDEAMDSSRSTIERLRMLSRGIAPPLLADRGLAVAVGEVAGRSVVPVKVDIDVPRLPLHVETAAYFVFTEALANMNKHSGAQHGRLAAVIEPTGRDGSCLLRLTIRDDGRGGADASKGHGLAGLQQRLAGLDGQLTVSSPVDGPTTIEAVIPCES